MGVDTDQLGSSSCAVLSSERSSYPQHTPPPQLVLSSSRAQYESTERASDPHGHCSRAGNNCMNCMSYALCLSKMSSTSSLFSTPPGTASPSSRACCTSPLMDRALSSSTLYARGCCTGGGAGACPEASWVASPPPRQGRRARAWRPSPPPWHAGPWTPPFLRPPA